jgi:hypothetical protein
MARLKASKPATARTVNGLRTKGFAGRQNLREATSDLNVMQALAVFDGQQCIGHLLPKGKLGVAAYDADDRLLGVFPTQCDAADAVSEQISSKILRGRK